MKKTRFTEEQMVTILRRPTGAGPGGGQEARRQRQTIYAWRKHFGRLEPMDVKRLRRSSRRMAG